MIVTPCFPFRLILSSLSRVTPGDFSRTSMAVEPALEGEASTFTTIRAAFCSRKGRLATTANSFRLAVALVSTNGGTLRVGRSLEMVKEGEKKAGKPTEKA